MDIIDVSPGDLWVPADSLNGRLGEMLGGDCHSDDEALGPIYHINDGWRARDALRRVLAAGERCVACEGTGRCPVSDRVCTACGGRPHTLGGPAIGTGYTRPPHDLGHFIDAEIAGRITPLAAAGLMWASVLRVEAGLGPVVGPATCGSEDASALLDSHRLSVAHYALYSPNRDHILLPLPDRIARLRLEG